MLDVKCLSFNIELQHIGMSSIKNLECCSIIHILLSQVYCVWQVVKTPTVISNTPVHCNHFLLYSCILLKTAVIFHSLQSQCLSIICPSVSCCFYHIFHRCCCNSSCISCFNSPVLTPYNTSSWDIMLLEFQQKNLWNLSFKSETLWKSTPFKNPPSSKVMENIYFRIVVKSTNFSFLNYNLPSHNNISKAATR